MGTLQGPSPTLRSANSLLGFWGELFLKLLEGDRCLDIIDVGGVCAVADNLALPRLEAHVRDAEVTCDLVACDVYDRGPPVER